MSEQAELRKRKGDVDNDDEKLASEEEFDEDNSWKQYAEVEKTQTKTSDLGVRLKSAIILAVSFIYICYKGLRPTVILVNFLQFCLFKELLDVRYVNAVEKQIPYFRTLHWFWFATAMYFTYAPQIIELFLYELPYLECLVTYHSIICICLYSFNFILFVLSLKKGCLKYQISQIAWTLLTIVLVVLQTSSMITNMTEGMLWFFFPVLLVCINDSFAYIFGKLFGKKFIKSPLTALSPKKSWEGFIGGGITTLLVGYYMPYVFKYIPQWYCPYKHFDCELPSFLIPHVYTMPSFFSIAPEYTISLLPLQIHGLVLALFASIVTPFGGLFASAIKRAYGKKDFNNIIPGHGGLMDRLDCQLLMILFTGVYYPTFVRVSSTPVENVIKTVSSLSLEDKETVLKYLLTTVKPPL